MLYLLDRRRSYPNLIELILWPTISNSTFIYLKDEHRFLNPVYPIYIFNPYNTYLTMSPRTQYAAFSSMECPLSVRPSI